MPKISAFVVTLAVVFAAASCGAANAVGLGETCAGVGSIVCDSGLWCEMDAGLCDNATAEGHCVHAPHMCNMLYLPVCACGGKTFGNDCARRAARAQKAHNGPCAVGAPGGMRRHRDEPDASKNQ